ncbi:TetR/AcrR family transcriptional regulator [Mammaliicoccus fleurettii]|nr:TetR/AcrR family transcriptional regulator [Mammaliicoccus fleurettii]
MFLETRNLIIETAKELLVERGYHDLKVADICRTAGLGKGTFYYYFEHKSQLIDIIGMMLINEIEYQINQLDNQKNTDAMIIDLFNIFIDFSIEKRQIMNNLLAATSESEWMNSLRTGYKPFRKVIALKLFNDESASSLFKVKYIMGIVDFYIKEEILDNNIAKDDRILSVYIKMIMSGIDSVSENDFK